MLRGKLKFLGIIYSFLPEDDLQDVRKEDGVTSYVVNTEGMPLTRRRKRKKII